MPQAPEELRHEWACDSTAISYLEKRGFTLNRDWTWYKEGQALDNLTPKEFRAILYLIQEWDFGGLRPQPGTPAP